MSASRLQTTFARLAAEDRAAFVTYVMAGDPGPEDSFDILTQLAQHADIIELGMPFSDPMAEGPAIQKAAQRSLKVGTKMRDVLGMVRPFRAMNADTPIVLMGYLNPVESHGYDAFAADAAAAGVDGLIIVDCPPEEAWELAGALSAHQLSLIRLATPTTDDARLKVVAEDTSGFVYYVSVAGVTGVKEADAAAVAPSVERIRAATGLPVAVGFGIKTPKRAAEVARVADAVVVGSALVEEIDRALAENRPVVPAVISMAADLKSAVRAARLARAEKER